MSEILLQPLEAVELREARSASVLLDMVESPSRRPSVGRKTRAKGTKRKKENARRSRVGKTREKLWYTVMGAWKESNLPQPTHQLVIHLCSEEISKPTSAGMELRRHLDAISSRIVKAGAPWLAGWVIEVNHGIHAHVILYLPNDAAFREKFARWLIKRFGMMCRAGRSAIFELQRTDGGEPVHLGVITPAKRYRLTGRRGLDGLIDYCGKAIVKGCRRTSNGIKLGRQVSFSAPVRQLVGNQAEMKVSAAAPVAY